MAWALGLGESHLGRWVGNGFGFHVCRCQPRVQLCSFALTVLSWEVEGGLQSHCPLGAPLDSMPMHSLGRVPSPRLPAGLTVLYFPGLQLSQPQPVTGWGLALAGALAPCPCS